MKKETIMKAAFCTAIVLLFCSGCDIISGTGTSSSSENIAASSKTSKSTDDLSEISSNEESYETVVVTSEDGVKKTLLSGSWMSCDSQAAINMHGGEKIDDNVKDDKKGKFINSSIWFENNNSFVFTSNGEEIKGTYKIKDDYSIDMNFEKDNKVFSEDTSINFVLKNDNKYGVILYGTYKKEKLRYFVAMI